MIDITGLDKVAVLTALYNASRPLGMGFLHATPGGLSPEDAKLELARTEPHGLYFDYLRGRVMKVSLSADMLDPRLYDRDNGEGAAARAISKIR